MKVLIPESLAEEGIEQLKAHFEVDTSKLTREQLLERIGDYDALIVRSATQVDRELLERAPNLKVVGRAGIGLDNIDLEAATRQGIVVVNAPQSNILSAAEHAMALMLALARNVPAAHAALKDGRWERERWTGVELHGKTLGILGLGRIGTLVAQRAASFGMKLLAYDPYVSKERAAKLGIALAGSIDQLCAESDFLTVHLPKTSETAGIIGVPQLKSMKPGARIINTARGGIVDEEALVTALQEGWIAGAGIDVFSKEPPGEHPLFAFEQVVATPHLGASTEEAQTKAGTSIAEQVLLALNGEFAPYAVNISAGMEFVEALKPYMPLTETLGRILTGIAGAGVSSVHFEFQGAIAEHDTSILRLAGLKGLFDQVVHEPVTFVNAPLMAEERGIAIKDTKSASARDYVNLVVISAETGSGVVSVAGTLMGKRDQAKIVRVYDHEIEVDPARYMCFIRYEDRPGVIGRIGTICGRNGINIASIRVGRHDRGGEALMALTVDSDLEPEVIKEIAGAAEARDVKFIDLGPAAPMASS